MSARRRGVGARPLATTPSTARLALLAALLGVGAFAVSACGRPASLPPPVPVGSAPPSTSSPAGTPETAAPVISSLASPTASPVASSASPSTLATATASPAPNGPLAAVLVASAGNIQRLFDDATRAPPAILQAKGAMADDPLAKGLRDVAKRTAPDMDPEGPLATGTLREKQNLQTDITLEPDRCYAIVGYSKQVRDLDLYLLLSPGILSAQDTTDDGSPAIGGARAPLCSFASTAITYKLDIVADQGAGDIVVQLYAKKK